MEGSTMNPIPSPPVGFVPLPEKQLSAGAMPPPPPGFVPMPDQQPRGGILSSLSGMVRGEQDPNYEGVRSVYEQFSRELEDRLIVSPVAGLDLGHPASLPERPVPPERPGARSPWTTHL